MDHDTNTENTSYDNSMATKYQQHGIYSTDATTASDSSDNGEMEVNQDTLSLSDSIDQKRSSLRGTPLSLSYSTIYEEEEGSKTSSKCSSVSTRQQSTTNDIPAITRESPTRSRSDLKSETVSKRGSIDTNDWGGVDGERVEINPISADDTSKDTQLQQPGENVCRSSKSSREETISLSGSHSSVNSIDESDHKTSLNQSSRHSSRASSLTPRPCSIQQLEETVEKLSSSSLRCVSPSRGSPRQPNLQILRDILQDDGYDEQTISEYTMSRKSSRQSDVKSKQKTDVRKSVESLNSIADHSGPRRRGSSDSSIRRRSDVSLKTRDISDECSNVSTSEIKSRSKKKSDMASSQISVESFKSISNDGSSVVSDLETGVEETNKSNDCTEDTDVKINEQSNEIRDISTPVKDIDNADAQNNNSGVDVKRIHERHNCGRIHTHQQIYNTRSNTDSKSKRKETRTTTGGHKQNAVVTDASVSPVEDSGRRSIASVSSKTDGQQVLQERPKSAVRGNDDSPRPDTGYHTRPDTGYHSAKTQRGKKISEVSGKSSKSDAISVSSATSVSTIDVNWLYKQLKTSLQKLRQDSDDGAKARQSKTDVYITLKILTDLLKFSERTKSVVRDLREELNSICQRKDSDSIKVDNLSIYEDDNLERDVENAIKLTDKVLDELSETGVAVGDTRDAISPVLIRSQVTSAFSFDTGLEEDSNNEQELDEVVGIDQENGEINIDTQSCVNGPERLSPSERADDNQETLSISDNSQIADQFSLRSATLSPSSFFETEEADIGDFINEENGHVVNSESALEMPQEKCINDATSVASMYTTTFESSEDILESYSDWPQKIFYGVTVTGVKEISCIVRCKSRTVDLEMMLCETHHEYNPSPVGDFEILRSHIIHLTYDGHHTSETEFLIALPVMDRGLESWEEIVFKEMEEGDIWKARHGRSRLFTGIINEEFNTLELKTCHLRPIALVSRPNAQHLTHNFMRGNVSDDEFSSSSAPAYMTSEIDSNITLDVLASDLEGTGDVAMQVVPVDSTLLTTWQKTDEENTVIMAASSVVIIEQLRDPCNQLLLTVPLTYPHDAVTYSSAARFKPPTEMHFVKLRQSGGMRVVPYNSENVKRGVETISVNFDDKSTRYLAIKTRKDVAPSEITPVVESLLVYLMKKVFWISVSVDGYNMNTASIKVNIRGHRSSRCTHVKQDEHQRTKEIRVKEGSNLEFRFRGNVDFEYGQPIVFPALFAQEVSFSRDIAVLDVFAQRTLKMYSGFLQIYASGFPQDITPSRSPGSTTPREEFTEIVSSVSKLMVEFDITFPKDNTKLQRQYKPMNTEIKSEGPVNEFYLKRLGVELSNDWESLVTWLEIPRPRVQAILCHNDNVTDGQFVFYLLVSWFKKLPKSANKAEILIKVLQKCSRHDLAERLDELNISHKADITGKAKETSVRKAVQCLCKEEAVHMNWVSLAYFLGLSDSAIKTIEIEYRRQEDKKCEKMIHKWLNYNNIENNIAKLALGLKLIGCNVAAEYLVTNMCEARVISNKCKMSYNKTVLNDVEAS